MKTYRVLAWVGVLLLLPFISTAQRGCGGWCSTNHYSRLFNAKTIEEVKGTVVSIEKMTPETGMANGVHLMVKTEKNENIAIHLGPAWYIDNQDMQFAAGDVLVIKGSRITYQNAPALIAMRVQKGDQILTLRDKKGAPAWNGCRHGKGRPRT